MKKDMVGHKAPVGELYRALLSLKNEAEVKAFLGDVGTPAEVAAWADRWHAAQLLAQGETQRRVAARTHISLATVTRVARFLNDGFGGYKLALERLSKK